MKQHHNLLELVATGPVSIDQNGQAIRRSFGGQAAFEIKPRFPLDLNGPVKFEEVRAELLWMLSGSRQVQDLHALGSHRHDELALPADVTKKVPKTAFELVNELSAKLNIDPRLVGNMLSMADKIEPESEDPSVIYSGAQRLLVEKGIELEQTVVDIPAGDMGVTAGQLWKDFEGTDQLIELIDGLKKNPLGQPHVLASWHPAKMRWIKQGDHHNNILTDGVASQPQVPLVQFFVRESMVSRIAVATKAGIVIPDHLKGEELTAFLDEREVQKWTLDCQIYQQYGNAWDDVPFATALYALLTAVLAWTVDMMPGVLHHTFGEIWLTEEQTTHVRSEEPWETPKLSGLSINSYAGNMLEMKPEDLELL